MAIESDLLASAPGTACVRIPPLAPGSYHDIGSKTPGGQSPLPEPEGEVWLANGIYAGWLLVAEGRLPAAISIGSPVCGLRARYSSLWRNCPGRPKKSVVNAQRITSRCVKPTPRCGTCSSPGAIPWP